MDDAIKKVRQFAASALVRKDKLKQELDALEAQNGEALADRIASKRGELAEAEAGYQEIISELRVLQDAAKAGVRAAPINATAPDPFAPSAEDRSLENVRSHIDQLSALAELNEELDGSKKFEQVEKASAEADARAQLAELKAKKQSSAAPVKTPKKTL